MPPFRPDRKTDLLAATVRAIAIVVCAGASTWLLASLTFLDSSTLRLFLTTLALLGGVGALALAKIGRLRAAGWLLVGLTWAAVTGGVLLTGSIHGRAFAGYYVALVMAGLLLNRRATLTVALLSSGIGAWLAVAPSTESSVPLLTGESPAGTWASNTLFLLVTGLLLAFARSRIDWALDTAEEKEQEILDRNRELEASRARFRLITESTQDLILETDGGGRLLYASPNVEQVLGYRAEEMIGTTVYDHIHPQDAEAVRRTAIELKEDSQTYDRPFRVQHRDGSWIWCESDGRAFLTSEGDLNTISVTRDITKRRELERRLQQAQKLEAVGRLAGGIAHDFNNVLTVIEGYGEMLLGSDRATPVEKEIAEIHRAAQRGARLTRQLLAFSRQQVLRPEVLDVRLLLDDLESMLHRILGEDIEISTHCDVADARILADRSQIEQVLVNLAVNARDAMPTGGLLSIAVDSIAAAETLPEPGFGPDREWLRLRVEDNGEGMSPEVRDRVFEPFFTTKQQGQGTGLGLSTVHGIVEQSGGWITIASEPGEGTTVDIYLPQADEQPASQRRERARRQRDGEATGSILLVEDDPALQRLAASILRGAGYDVAVADNGLEALRLASRDGDSFDLLLTDVVMPQMGGIELRDRLRAERPGIHVLFMSGYTEHPSLHGPSLEADALILEKPFSPDDLLDLVADLMAERKSRT